MNKYPNLNKIAETTKQSNSSTLIRVLLGLGLIGGGVGAHVGGPAGFMHAPKGHRAEGLGRGLIRGAGAGAGAASGIALGANLAGFNPLASLAYMSAGGIGGGIGGDYLARLLAGKPSWETNKETEEKEGV